ncbi:hypothetical protein BJX64DRAFT_266232 [Aspergillus heterothallicus]
MSPQQWNHWRDRWCDCQKCFAIISPQGLLNSSTFRTSPWLVALSQREGSGEDRDEADGTLEKRSRRWALWRSKLWSLWWED